MKRYIALLRGINISGKNKIAMAELKLDFAEIGFEDVVSYLNSGNVAFSSDLNDKNALSSKIQSMIKDKFDLDIPTLVIEQEELKDMMSNAPDWWGSKSKETYDNLIFLMPPLSNKEFCDEIGELKAEYEKAFNYKEVVFWSFSLKDYRKTNWWSKTANSKISGKITIRTANTVKKLICL